MPPVDAPGLGAEPYRQAKREYTAANKVFDYMDAAVPVIMDPDIKFLYWFVKRYHPVIDFDAFVSDPRNTVQDLLANHAEELSQARRILSVRRQIRRLITFYESI
jgi:hypothetical protein